MIEIKGKYNTASIYTDSIEDEAYKQGIYHPIEELSRKDPAKHNWYNTAEDESDCKKKIKELVKSGKYKKRELTYRYFQW